MTLLICPVRPGDDNEELRFAIRSWEANLHLADGLELWTVGHQPSWLVPDRHVPANRYPSVATVVFDNVLLAAHEADIAGYREVAFMNDDFFCLDPVGAILPVRRNQTLAEHLTSFPTESDLWWPRSLRLTASWLASEGFPHPDSYEVHRPLLADPGAMVSALLQWGDTAVDVVPQWRTVYGTLAEVEAHPVPDVKLGGKVTGFGSPWVSTSDLSWRRYRGLITPRFQKPSRWER